MPTNNDPQSRKAEDGREDAARGRTDATLAEFMVPKDQDVSLVAITPKGEVVVCGKPSSDDENHNCDAMGCGCWHVLWRHKLPPSTPPSEAAPRAVSQQAGEAQTGVYWALDSDLCAGPEDAGVLIARCVSPGHARALALGMNERDTLRASLARAQLERDEARETCVSFTLESRELKQQRDSALAAVEAQKARCAELEQRDKQVMECEGDHLALIAETAEQQERIASLEAELAARDARIAELIEHIQTLNMPSQGKERVADLLAAIVPMNDPIIHEALSIHDPETEGEQRAPSAASGELQALREYHEAAEARFACDVTRENYSQDVANLKQARRRYQDARDRIDALRRAEGAKQ